MLGKSQKTDGMDRISDLPPFIIHQIMSYLSTKELDRTSVLSKRWNYLRASFPIMDFDQTYFMGRDLEVHRELVDEQIYDVRFNESTVNFLKFVQATLARFCKLEFCMQKFRICISLVPLSNFSSILDEWICLAAKFGVRDLNVKILTNRGRLYNLPQLIFSAETLTTLTLSGCKLEQPSDTVKLCFLKSITLEKVHMTEEIVQKLTSECHSLENLYFHYCWGIKSFYINKPRKLKILDITKSFEDDLESIKIFVPSLLQLSLVFENMQSEPCVIDIAGCPHLNDLHLAGDIFMRQEEFQYIISKFPSLETLSVMCCRFLERVIISSNRLKNLWISYCDNLKEIDVDTPNLRFFGYQCNPIPISSINAPCPWRVEFNCQDADTDWYLNMKKFLRASDQICDLSIIVESCMNTFNGEDLRKCLPVLPSEVENLSLYAPKLQSNYAAFLDGIFWICYPKQLSIRPAHSKFSEWFYDELMNEDVNCCNSQDIKCWRHYLKDFAVESYIIKNDDEPMAIEDLQDVFSTRPTETLRFCLDWSFPVVDSIVVGS